MQLSRFDDQPLKSLKQGRRNQFIDCFGFAVKSSWVYDSLDSPVKEKKDKGLDTKPIGLWLSDENSKEGRGWKDLCIDQLFNISLGRIETLIEADMSRTLHLSTIEDVIEFGNQYGYKTRTDMRGILWNELSKDYAGILISPWKKETCYQLDSNDYLFYGAWDCSSACFWDASALEITGHKLAFGSRNDALEEIEKIGFTIFDGSKPIRPEIEKETYVEYFYDFAMATIYLFENVQHEDLKEIVDKFRSGIELSLEKRKTKIKENPQILSRHVKCILEGYSEALELEFEKQMKYEKHLEDKKHSESSFESSIPEM